MRLIESSVIEIVQEPNVEGMYRHIDYCAGVCYGRNAAHSTFAEQQNFVDNLRKKGHCRPLEFGTVYLHITPSQLKEDTAFITSYILNSPYTIANVIPQFATTNIDNYVITTNFRVVVEAYEQLQRSSIQCNMSINEYLTCFWAATDELLSENAGFKKRKTFAWKCSRGIADEFRTHITLSSMMKSTRYVNEMKNGIEFVKPFWYQNENGEREKLFRKSCEEVERYYNQCVNELGMKPQEAREILPLSLATDLYQCGFVNMDGVGWNRFLAMRCDHAAHPDAQKLAYELKTICR